MRAWSSKLVVPLMLMLLWACGRGNPSPERTGVIDSRRTNSVTALTSNVTAPIAAGLYHTCAIVNGAAQCWGYNNYGQTPQARRPPSRTTTVGSFRRSPTPGATYTGSDSIQ